MATVLDRQLKRQVTVDDVDYTVAIDPEGFRLTGKGKRRPEVEVRWRDLLSGEAAMAVALRRVLEEPSFRNRSLSVAAEIAALPDVDAAVDAMLTLA